MIGFGFVSKTFHVPLLQATDGYKIASVSSSRPGDVSGILPDVEVVSDPQALATHPDIDLVVIASPNETHAPLAEVQRYATDLRSLTQGRGTYTSKVIQYEEVPAHVADKIIDAHRKEADGSGH